MLELPMSLDILFSRTNLWPTDRVGWIDQREKEWGLVEPRLSGFGSSYTGQVKQQLKRYFLRGTATFPDFYVVRGRRQKKSYGSLPDALLQIWFCPVQLKSEDISFGPEYKFDLTDSRSKFFQRQYVHMLSSQPPALSTYGAMGGRERMIVDILNPSLDYRQNMKFGGRIVAGGCLLPSEITNLTVADSYAELYKIEPSEEVPEVALSRQYIPFSPGIYLWEHLNFALDAYPTEIYHPRLIVDRSSTVDVDFAKRIERIDHNFDRMLRALLVFADQPDSSAAKRRPNTVRFAEELVNRFEKRDFSENMLKRWDAAHRASSRAP